MKFTFSWLKKFLDTDSSVQEIGESLTSIGLELEEIIDRSKDFAGFVVGEVLEAAKHPEADKLKVCKVKTADRVLQIVCGASNARAGIKVVVARIGSVIPNGNFTIKESEIRGIKSQGMICSEEELRLGSDGSGIIELPEHLGVNGSFISYYGLDDPVLHINITPNRADALGVYGIARDLAAKGMGNLKNLPDINIDSSCESKYHLAVENKVACPLFSTIEIQSLSNKKTPDWLKKLLEATGIGSISPVVDVTNYIAFSFGQPMHAYDADKISGGLRVKLLDTACKFHALNEKEYMLDKGDIVIEDDLGPKCVAGIIGGKVSACDENTKNIILESAYFNADYIIATGRRLQIDTSSRYRFERGVDNSFTMQVPKIAASMILEVCGGLASGIKHMGEPSVKQKKIDFSLDDLARTSGVKLPIEEVSDILIKLGFKVDQVSEQKLSILIPSWRQDTTIKEGIVEEILRIYGYNHIPEISIPSATVKRLLSEEQERIAYSKRVISGQGYDEVVTWSFIDSAKAEMFGKIQEELTILNPISSEMDYMRPSILPGLLMSASKNIAGSIKDISIFEIGPVFFDPSPKGEIISAAGIRIGSDYHKNHYEKTRLVDVFDIKTDLEVLFESLGFSTLKCKFMDAILPYYHPTRSATITLGKNVIGHFGNIHPLVLKKFDIETEVVAFELNLMNIPFSRSRVINRSEFQPSNFQPVTGDYAFIVPKAQAVGDILSYIKVNNRKYVKSVALFDVYSGSNIVPDKQSIALSVEIQATDRTLTENDLNEISRNIISGVEKQFGAELRD